MVKKLFKKWRFRTSIFYLRIIAWSLLEKALNFISKFYPHIHMALNAHRKKKKNSGSLSKGAYIDWSGEGHSNSFFVPADIHAADHLLPFSWR